MGNNPSITDQQKQELWNRDISRLFTTAKIVPIQPFSTSFIHTITTKGDQNENRLICLFCNDGKIRGILNSSNSTFISSSNILTIVAESQNLFSINQNKSSTPCFFSSAIQLSEKYIVVTINNGNFFLISAREKQSTEQNLYQKINTYFEFNITSFSLPSIQKIIDNNLSTSNDFSSCIVRYTNDSFIAIDYEMTAALCRSDGSIQIIWDGNQLQTNQLPDKTDIFPDNNSRQHFSSTSPFCCASVYENYLFIIHFSHDGIWKGLTYGIVKERITPLQSFDDALKNIIVMDTYESGIFCLCDSNSKNNITENNDDKGRFSVISIDIDKNQIIKSPIFNFNELNQADNYVVDFKVVDNKKTLLCLTENSIITYTAELENHLTHKSINITGKLEFSRFASLSSQVVFNVVATCDQQQPNLYILKLLRKSKKIQLELLPMNVKLNEGIIVCSCPVDDFSFATIDEKGKIVLWISQPEWWDVPYFQKIFDTQLQQ